MNRFDYYYWKSKLSELQINNIHNIIEDNFENYQNVNQGASDIRGNFKKSSTVKEIKYKFIEKELKDVIDFAQICNRQFYGYNLYSLSDSIVALYNIYSSKNKAKYDWHSDISRLNCSDTKLTLIINLSNKYTGGEFELNSGNIVEVKEFSNPGSVIIFKSDILHRVKPVLTGERRTLTIFLDGPKWI